MIGLRPRLSRGSSLVARCVVGRWLDQLDAADRQAFKRATSTRSRIDLFGMICAAAGVQPFSLTALKDHINPERCVCD